MKGCKTVFAGDTFQILWQPDYLLALLYNLHLLVVTIKCSNTSKRQYTLALRSHAGLLTAVFNDTEHYNSTEAL